MHPKCQESYPLDHEVNFDHCARTDTKDMDITEASKTWSQKEQDIPVSVTTLSQAEPSNSNSLVPISSVSLEESAVSTSGIQDEKEEKEEKNERKEQQDRSTSSHVPGNQTEKQEADANSQQTEDFTQVQEPQDEKEEKEERNERKEQQDRSTSSHVPGSQAGKQEAGANGQQTEDFTQVQEPQEDDILGLRHENEGITTSLKQLEDQLDDFCTKLELKTSDYRSLQEKYQTLLNQMMHMIGDYLKKNAD